MIEEPGRSWFPVRPNNLETKMLENSILSGTADVSLGQTQTSFVHNMFKKKIESLQGKSLTKLTTNMFSLSISAKAPAPSPST